MAAFIEFIPLLAFFIAYKFIDIYWATGVLIIAVALQIAFSYFTQGKVDKKQWIFLAVTVVFGGLTVALRDETFIMWKPSVIYLIFTLALLISQYGFDKPVLKSLLGEMLKVEDKVWRTAGLIWAGFFALAAVLNLYVAYNFDQDTWVNFKVFGMTVGTLVLTIATVFYLFQQMSEEDKAALMEEEESDKGDNAQSSKSTNNKDQ